MRFYNFVLALAVILFMVFSQTIVFALGEYTFLQFPMPFIFLSIGLPAVFIGLSVMKIWLQNRMDQKYDADEVNELQRRTHPKLIQSFPVKPVLAPEILDHAGKDVDLDADRSDKDDRKTAS